MKTRTKTLKTGHTIEAKVGDYLDIDERSTNCGIILSACDVPPCPGWPGADFCFPSLAGPSPVNIFVIGRTIQFRSGGAFVRVEIEFVGDCEESAFTKGWLAVQL